MLHGTLITVYVYKLHPDQTSHHMVRWLVHIEQNLNTRGARFGSED